MVQLLAAGAAVLYCAYQVREVIIPFALSLALAYLVNPLINIFEAHGLRRDHIVLALYLLIAAVITLAANFLIPTVASELDHLQSQAPYYYAQTKDILAAMQKTLAHHLPVGQSVIEHWSLRMYNPVTDHLQEIPGYLLGLLPLLSLLFVVPFITFFMLMDASKFVQRTIQICPSRYVEKALHLVCEIDNSLGSYVRGMLTVALTISAASFAGLLVLNVDYALAIATLSGVSSFIPYAGVVIGGAVSGIVAFFQFHTLKSVLEVLCLFFGIRMADEILLQPIIAKHSVHLNPVIYLLAIMVGGRLFGFVGLIFAVPFACIVKALMVVSWDWYASEHLFGGIKSPDGADIPYV